MSTSTSRPVGPSLLQRTSREALTAMAVQFLLGMAANLIGPPSESSGWTRGVAVVVLALHALVGLSLIVVGVRVLLATRRHGAGRRPAAWALGITVTTFLVGIGTMVTGSGGLSFLMSAGFLATAALYVRTSLLGAGAVPADPGDRPADLAERRMR
jgi:hypothetical protein